ncbi:MAG TPA: cyclic pyranopterin monophosphate synthase MoaC [Candidatus Limnocylindria bacterium]|jgi:cyclic pyranopterin phosphate synthase|nr:cyclic pyranopterin monophosphate synthase MoaC [Candidatus Limnocylindria bacterium]
MPPSSRRKTNAAYLQRIKDEAVSTRSRSTKASRGEKPALTHIDTKGAARMVDVGAKGITNRRAVARGLLRVSPATRALVRDGATPKGDVLAAARLAGIMAAKKTSELIPLTHPLPLTHAAVELTIEQDGIAIEATVSTSAQTGVEMEALTAVSIAGLTLYDMLKSVERGARLTDVRLVEKTGGKSGTYRAR